MPSLNPSPASTPLRMFAAFFCSGWTKVRPLNRGGVVTAPWKDRRTKVRREQTISLQTCATLY